MGCIRCGRFTSRPCLYSSAERANGMKPGTRVRLISMSDPYSVPPGTVGVVEGCDALGDYLVSWANGSSLKLIEGIDEWEVLDETNALFSALPTASHSGRRGD